MMYTIVPDKMNHPVSFENAFMPFFRPYCERVPGHFHGMIRTDVRENENGYLLEAELPGFDAEQINVSVNKDTLTISASREVEKHDEENCRIERRRGKLERTFELEGIDQQGITASYKNGILYVSLPKEQKEENTSRKITVVMED